jgi:hypothetical protein
MTQKADVIKSRSQLTPIVKTFIKQLINLRKLFIQNHL